MFVIALGSRRVVRAGVARHPTGAWVAKQPREETPCGERPRFLNRDNDGTCGSAFSRLAAATRVEQMHRAYRAPKKYAACERFLGSVRRQCLDHLLILGEMHLRRILREYVPNDNHDRPHQGLQQRVPSVDHGVFT
jgi:transposase InsO family protein